MRYEDGDLPITIDISCRERENEINPKVCLFYPDKARIKRFSKQVFVATNVVPMKQQESVNMVKTVFIVMNPLICVVVVVLCVLT